MEFQRKMSTSQREAAQRATEEINLTAPSDVTATTIDPGSTPRRKGSKDMLTTVSHKMDDARADLVQKKEKAKNYIVDKLT
ncbi:unnamed protein product [Cylicostephanus goldi]|uniref:Uncharacterized protein n=1 Tax=Cylicostephanus goldi TaxID=71465 RepID=A0A3P6SL94_CYLGO|nr:unnamed protein product [Cylicostephanus goldi]